MAKRIIEGSDRAHMIDVRRVTGIMGTTTSFVVSLSTGSNIAVTRKFQDYKRARSFIARAQDEGHILDTGDTVNDMRRLEIEIKLQEMSYGRRVKLLNVTTYLNIGRVTHIYRDEGSVTVRADDGTIYDTSVLYVEPIDESPIGAR